MKRLVIHKYELTVEEVKQAIINKMDPFKVNKITFILEGQGIGIKLYANVDLHEDIKRITEDEIKEAVQEYMEAFDVKCETEEIKIYFTGNCDIEIIEKR